MVYLEPGDFTDEQKLAELAGVTTLDPTAFRESFEYVARA
jgi:hypothetical protein